jgi:hypothetical protein
VDPRVGPRHRPVACPVSSSPRLSCGTTLRAMGTGAGRPTAWRHRRRCRIVTQREVGRTGTRLPAKVASTNPRCLCARLYGRAAGLAARDSGLIDLEDFVRAGRTLANMTAGGVEGLRSVDFPYYAPRHHAPQSIDGSTYAPAWVPYTRDRTIVEVGVVALTVRSLVIQVPPCPRGVDGFRGRAGLSTAGRSPGGQPV